LKNIIIIDVLLLHSWILTFEIKVQPNIICKLYGKHL